MRIGLVLAVLAGLVPALAAQSKAKVESIEGIGTTYGDRLRGLGITTTGQLLQTGATPAGRTKIADATGVTPQTVLEWVNRADLSRVKGVAGQYADLLEAADVDTPRELAQRNPDQLWAKLKETNAATPKVRKLPARSTVARWIAQAKTLPQVVQH